MNETSPLAPARLDHVALAVPDLRRAVDFYMGQLGATFVVGGDNKIQGFRSVVLSVPGGRIELLQGLGAGAVSTFVERTGGGFHHLAFHVEEFDAYLDQLRSSGYQLTGLGANPDGLRRDVFIRPSTMDNALIQIIWEHPTFLEGFDHSLEEVLQGEGIIVG